MSIILYLLTGCAFLFALWRVMDVHWAGESLGTKFLLLATPFIWPLVAIFIGVIGLIERSKRS